MMNKTTYTPEVPDASNRAAAGLSRLFADVTDVVAYRAEILRELSKGLKTPDTQTAKTTV